MELTKEQMSELSDEVLCVNACAGDRASEEALVMSLRSPVFFSWWGQRRSDPGGYVWASEGDS